MEHIEVKSSHVKSMGYEKGILEIYFKNTQALYRYKNVSREIWEDLQKAPSKGKFINNYIVQHYACEIVDG